MSENRRLGDVQLPLKLKICYGAGGFSKVVLVYATAMFLLNYYTDVLGISGKISGTIILIAKIWDIINDPMMGAIVDRTHPKEGRCRFYLKYFSVPAGVVLALCFMVPELTTTGKIVWVAVTYTLQGMASTVLLIPMNTMIGRMTTDKVQQAHLNQFSAAFQQVGGFLVTALTLPLVDFFGHGDMHKGFIGVGIIYGVLYAVGHLLVYWGTKGYESSEEYGSGDRPVAQAETKISSLLPALFKNTPWLVCILMYFIFNTGASFESSAMVYYLKYNVANTDLLSLYSLLTKIASIVPILGLGFFVKRFSVSGSAMLGAICYFLGFGIRFLLRDSNVAVMALGWLISSVGMGLIAATIVLQVLDTIVYGEWKTGSRNEAVIMSGFSLS